MGLNSKSQLKQQESLLEDSAALQTTHYKQKILNQSCCCCFFFTHISHKTTLWSLFTVCMSGNSFRKSSFMGLLTSGIQKPQENIHSIIKKKIRLIMAEPFRQSFMQETAIHVNPISSYVIVQNDCSYCERLSA